MRTATFAPHSRLASRSHRTRIAAQAQWVKDTDDLVAEIKR